MTRKARTTGWISAILANLQIQVLVKHRAMVLSNNSQLQNGEAKHVLLVSRLLRCWRRSVGVGAEVRSEGQESVRGRSLRSEWTLSEVFSQQYTMRI